MKIKISLAFLFLIYSLSSCSKEDEISINTNYSYIQFSHKDSNISQNTLKLSDQRDLIQQLAINFDLNIEDMNMLSSFEISSDSNIVIKTGETYGFMKIANNRIEIYKIDPGSNNQILIEASSPKFTFEKGQVYNVGFRKTYREVTFFLKKAHDTIFEKQYNIYDQTNKWAMWGKPFILIEKGSINITQSLITSDYIDMSKISIYGDSFVQGWALVTTGSDISHKWSTLLANNIGFDNCFIEGVGGERVCQSWYNKFKTLNSWHKSKYVILSIGTNNKDFNEYKEFMTKAIDLLKQNNQVPILITVTPKFGYDFTKTGALINDWIKSSGEKYIDMHKAVTKENDPTSWKDGYVLYDNIHPTIDGYKMMYDQLKIDCPFLIY